MAICLAALVAQSSDMELIMFLVMGEGAYVDVRKGKAAGRRRT